MAAETLYGLSNDRKRVRMWTILQPQNTEPGTNNPLKTQFCVGGDVSCSPLLRNYTSQSHQQILMLPCPDRGMAKSPSVDAGRWEEVT